MHACDKKKHNVDPISDKVHFLTEKYSRPERERISKLEHITKT